MTTKRKKHLHPALAIPRVVKQIWFADGKRFKQQVDYQDNDHGTVKDGRIYSYHPTKGWRNRRAKGAA